MCMFTLHRWLKSLYIRFGRPNICPTRTTVMWLEITLKEGEQGECLCWGRAARGGQLVNNKCAFSPVNFFTLSLLMERHISVTLWVRVSTPSAGAGGLSHCQSAPSYPFPLWEWTKLLIFIQPLKYQCKEKNWLKLVDFQHYFIGLKLKLCFIVIIECLLYAKLAISISLFDHDHTLWGNTSNIPILEMKILKLTEVNITPMITQQFQDSNSNWSTSFQRSWESGCIRMEGRG